MQSKNKINNNGFEYVDLCLPSGTLWATCNVGTSKPTDYGLYFQWGDTKGCTKDQVGKDKQFNEDDYKWGAYQDFTKYKKIGDKLELEDDAAHVRMGGGWHMPTPEQIKELIDNTMTTWTTLCGVKGLTFTSKKDSSKHIFIPAEGNAWDGLVNISGSYGYVWSSVLGMDTVCGSQFLIFNSEGAYLSDAGYRSDGLSVRGVIG